MLILITQIFFIHLEQSKFESDKIVCTSKDFCEVVMPFEEHMFLLFLQYPKFNKVSFLIYADL